MRSSLVLAAACFLSALSACRTPPESLSELPSEAQYCVSVGADGDETVEVLIRNTSASPVEFARAELDGVELPAGAASAARILKSFSFSGLDAGGRGRMPVSTSVAGARWWQFYPSPRIDAGGSAVFQLNFDGKSRPCDLKLTTRNGAGIAVMIPRYVQPRRSIEFLAFSGDGRSVLLRYSKGPAPECLSVNGRPVQFRILEASTNGRPGAVVAELSDPVREGDPTLVELGFPEGARRFALVRAMLGVCTEAVTGWDGGMKPVSERECGVYGFDATMRVRRLPFDVACDDTRAHRHGADARAVVASRRNCVDALCGVDFCTALYPSVWNIYSQMADAVISKPYKLHWGESRSRFIDEEDAFLANVVREVAPRPVLWVPERFRRLRELDGAEYDVLAWCAMLRGVRGVRCHHWLNDPARPFADNPRLAESVKRFNADFNRLRPRLERLIPMGEGENRPSQVVVLEGWSGDDGVLLLVKNQRYDVGIDQQTGCRVRPFSFSAVRDYRLAYRLPKWLSPGECVDALTGERLFSESACGVCKVTLPELGSHRLVWIGNAGKESVR